MSAAYEVFTVNRIIVVDYRVVCFIFAETRQTRGYAQATHSSVLNKAQKLRCPECVLSLVI